jgi:predicted MFS family arabinose efflux permease
MGRPFRRDLAILVPAIGAQFLATTGLFLAPFIVGALLSVGGAFDERTSGFLLSAEALSASITTIAFAAWTRPHSRMRTAMLGAALVLAGDALSLISTALPLLAAARLLAGIGAGIVTAEVAAVVARAHNRERLISLLTAGAILNGSIWIFIIPYAPHALGYRAPYLSLLLAACVGAMLLWRLPSPPLRQKTGPAQHAAPRASLLGYLVLPGIFLTQLGQGSFWTFVEIYGRNAGLSTQSIGGFLSLATLLLLIGVAATAAIGTRWGRIGPLFALTLVNAASIVAITYAKTPSVYVIANIIQAVTNLSSLVYQLGLSAAVDRSGRTLVAANGLVGLGNGLGSAVGGAIAVALGVANIGAAVALCNAIALACFGIVGAGLLRARVSAADELPIAAGLAEVEKSRLLG